MAKSCVGIDIGAGQLKLAACTGGVPRRLVTADMPDNLVRDGKVVSPEAMADFIKKTASKAKLGTRKCAVVLPAGVVFMRTMTIPAMTIEQLGINLPYEFRDFITQEKDKYFYDYAVLDTICDDAGKPRELELIAAATLKETIALYSDMCRKAGFKLVTAIPEEIAYMNIIRRFGEKDGTVANREYCFVDLGHTATRLHIYKGIKLQATRVVDIGAQMIDSAIAEILNIDEHTARSRKHQNPNNELSEEACKSAYASISIDAMRAINFYRFNNPDSALSDFFLCGGGGQIAPLTERLSADIGMPARQIDELLPKHGEGGAMLFHAAIGAAMQ